MNLTSFAYAGAIWFYFQRGPQSNPRIVYELKIFVAAKHTFVHHFNKIEQYLPFKPKVQMVSGQGSHWLIESPTMFTYM